MKQARAERIGHLMQEEIAAMLQREVKDPRIGFVSITRVEVARDLSQAKVYVSLLGDGEQQKASLAGLASAAGYLRGEVARRLNLRQAPELRFVPDHSIDASLRVHAVLNQLRAESPPPEEPGGGGR